MRQAGANQEQIAQQRIAGIVQIDVTPTGRMSTRMGSPSNSYSRISLPSAAVSALVRISSAAN